MTKWGNRALGSVLVTGAGGFLGGALLRRLVASGERTLATDRSAGDGGVHALDVTDLDQVTQAVADAEVDTIFHCGAISGPMVMPDRPLEILRVNVFGTANVLEAARLGRVGRILLCSSVDIYGSRNSAILEEDAPPDPDTVYGASKVAAEQALIGYCRQHGLDGTSLRFAWIYGPGRRTPSLIPRLLEDGLAGRETAVSVGADDITHYMHVDDAVAALVAAARVERLPRFAYNATAGQGIRMRELVGHVEALLPQARIHLRGGQATIAGPLGFENGNAKRDFGYAPQIALRDGLRRHLAQLRPEPRAR
jgi:UDP-glucose 4-epimerase